jgi:hypothetical protein
MCESHQVHEVPVDLSELSVLVCELSFDVLVANEDGLQVNPLPLHLEPELEHLGQVENPFGPLGDLAFEVFEAGREFHRG